MQRTMVYGGTRKLVCYILLVIALTLAGLLSAPKLDWADEPPEEEAASGFAPLGASYPPNTIAATFEVTDKWDTSGNVLPDHFTGILRLSGNYKVLHWGVSYDPTWSNQTLVCIDGAAKKDPDIGWVLTGTLTLVEYNAATGTARYSAMFDPYAPGYQRLSSAYVIVQWSGSIEIFKNSSSPDITNDNDCYSLYGAEYAIYNSNSDAQNDVNRIETITTVEDSQHRGGRATSSQLAYGTYYVKEIIPSPGYELDTNIHQVNINGSTVNQWGYVITWLLETPTNDPVLMFVQKLDDNGTPEDTSDDKPYGQDDPDGLSLAGAEFTVKYYAGYYETVDDVIDIEPTRVWVFETETTGRSYVTAELQVSGDPLYYYAGDATVPLGTITIQETKAPVGYLLPDPNPISLQRIELDSATQQVQRLNPLIVRERPHIAEVLKSDSASGEPVPDTEFTLYRESAPGAGDWQEVLRKVTDENGRFEIRPIAVGSYKLVETCPNPNYASAAESGADDCYFEIEASTTILTLEIVDDPIRIGCEVFKDTVNITSAAFRTNVGDYLQIDNTNRELFHYSLDFRSTASVRADEFTVIDPLESAGMGQVWLQELFTPVAWGDSDGLFNLWYQTNLTDPEKLYSEANAMASNPANPNNPKLEQLWPSVGWQLWQQDVPTTCTSHFLVSDLNLAEGEYVTALRFEFGSVEVGFTTHNSLLQGLQEKKELKPSTVDWTPRPASSTDKVSAGSQLTTLDAASATGLQPATYLVSCPQSLLPPVLLSSSAQVFIARNVVLTDTDSDAVQTSLINTFSVRPNSATPTDISTLAGYGVPRGGSGGRTTVSATGDNVFAVLALLASALGCAGLGVRLLCKRKQLRRGVHARRMWGLQRILRS